VAVQVDVCDAVLLGRVDADGEARGVEVRAGAARMSSPGCPAEQ
jgi:hypothetical protein